MRNIVISGYYGFDNLGDEAILAAIIEGIKQQRQNRITVLSANPSQTTVRYGVAAVNRNNPTDVLGAIQKSELLISGGGSLFQDITGWKSIPYYLSHVLLAQLLGKKTVFYAQGIGPVRGKLAQFLIKRIGNRTNEITVRDHGSRDLLRQFGIRAELVRVTVDPVFIFKKRCWGQGWQLLKKAGLAPEKKIMAISVKPWGDNRYLPELARAAQSWSETSGYQLLIIPLHYRQDLALSQRLQAMLKGAHLLTEPYGPMEMLEIFAEIDFLLGVRFHSLVFAAIHNCPFVAINYDPKITGLLSQYALNSQVLIGDFTAGSLERICTAVWQNRAGFKQILEQRGAEFYQLAQKNIEMLLQL